MGWFRNFLFGEDPAHDEKEDLPKRVREWQDDEWDRAEAANRDMEQLDEPKPAKSAPPNAYLTEKGSKVLPTLTVSRVEPHLSSDFKQLELWITLHNQSPYDIEVTKVDLLRQNIDPDRFLRAGESHEIRVYRGQTPRDRAYTKAFIDMKIVGNGDYFRQEYMIDYRLENGGGASWYVPSALKKSLPPRDT